MTITAVGSGDDHVEAVNAAAAAAAATSPADAPAEDGDPAVSQSSTGSTGTMEGTPTALPSADPIEEPKGPGTPPAAAACSASTKPEELGLTRYGNPRTVPEEAAGDGDGLNTDEVTTDGTSRDAPAPAHTIGKGSKVAKMKIPKGVRGWGEATDAFGVLGREKKVWSHSRFSLLCCGCYMTPWVFR